MSALSKNQNPSVLDYLQLRVFSCYQEALAIKEGQMPAPRMAIVYPTYLCNHRCLGCDYRALNKTGHSLSTGEFRNVIDQLIEVGIKGVEFCGGGEPTLHPLLPQIIDRLAQAQVDFGFLTNGTKLTPALRSRLVQHGSYCRISLESASERTFNLYKRPVNKSAGFKQVIRNLKNLVELKDKSPNTKLQISIKYAIDCNNYSNAPDVVALAARLKVDSLQYKLIRNMPSEIKDCCLLKDLEDKIWQRHREYPNLRIITDFKKSTLKGRCWLSPLQVVVDPYGDVYLCCYYRHRRKGHRLGNMLQNRFKDIWYAKEHLEKIAQIRKKDCNKYDCRFHQYNELMQESVIDDLGQLSFI